MATIRENPIFHVTLADGDEWAIEVEWADGTLEQITTFKAYFSAANWVSNRSEAWLQESGLMSVNGTPSHFLSRSGHQVPAASVGVGQ